MLEYVLAFAGLIIVCLILGHLVWVAKGCAERTENLVASEYP